MLKVQNTISAFNQDKVKDLLQLKQPLIYTEMINVSSDLKETVQDLGYVSYFIKDVKVFDDGTWVNPVVYEKPKRANLIWTCGLLLNKEVDLDLVLDTDKISDVLYLNEYRKRLVPVFDWISNDFSKSCVDTMNLKTVIIPGLGLGQFAGDFKGALEPLFIKTIKTIIKEYDFDKVIIGLHNYPESKEIINDTNFIISNKPHFHDSYFENTEVYCLVAWDHLSYPCNDFWNLHRFTDDGVKGACTNAMELMTNTKGYYDIKDNKFKPLNNKTWLSNLKTIKKF